MEHPHPILFFDGVCNLCNSSVQFILRNDRNGNLRFASLQSELAEELLPPFGIEPADLNSVVLYDKGTVYTRSTAVLRTLRHMGGPLSYLAVFGIVPRRLRDFFYNFISHNRYKWFGQRDECMLPSPEYNARFLGR